MKKVLFYLLGLLLIPVACFTPKSTVTPSVVNLSRMFNPSNTKFHPVYAVFHNTTSTSLLLVKIFPVELLYSGTIEPDKVLAQVNITYVLSDMTNPDQPVVADSGQVKYKFSRENADKRFVSQVVLPAREGKVYQLMVIAKDLVRNEENLTYMFVDKSSRYSQQNFLVTEADGGSPVFQPHVLGNSLFKLDYTVDAPNDSIFVRYYGKEIPLPKPSFSLTKEREYLESPDSLWILPFRKGVTYQLNYEGIYHFQLDTNKAEGITLFNFGDSYPKVQDVNQLVEPLAYLTTTPEYDKLKKAINQKLAVDNFWIEKAGNLGKARELIRVYYTRVFFANYYFTSFKPGWKTDRGMIFIIYGPPQSVKVTGTQEKWIYYKNNFTTMVTFTFNYVLSPFALNNCILERSDTYDTYWRQAVDTWRNGNIYLIE